MIILVAFSRDFYLISWSKEDSSQEHTKGKNALGLQGGKVTLMLFTHRAERAEALGECPGCWYR